MYKKSLILFVLLMCALSSIAQSHIEYTEIPFDTSKCLQVDGFEVIRSNNDLLKIPINDRDDCQTPSIDDIDLENNILVICCQHINNGQKAINSTKIKVLRDDAKKQIAIKVLITGNTHLQRNGKVYEHRNNLLIPKFPNDYTVDVDCIVEVAAP